eukprot:6066446-Pyramimonas_sp.AAC.1
MKPHSGGATGYRGKIAAPLGGMMEVSAARAKGTPGANRPRAPSRPDGCQRRRQSGAALTPRRSNKQNT